MDKYVPNAEVARIMTGHFRLLKIVAVISCICAIAQLAVIAAGFWLTWKVMVLLVLFQYEPQPKRPAQEPFSPIVQQIESTNCMGLNDPLWYTPEYRSIKGNVVSLSTTSE
jgi:hypothetical protein